MRDLNDKVTTNTLTASEWNDMPSELQNIIENLGITLSGADLNQVGKAIAGYVANGAFYSESGVADAYVLTAIGLKQSPPAYADGFEVSFIPGNTNTGASTINVATIGVKTLADITGNVLAAGVLLTDQPMRAYYNLATDEFRLLTQLVTSSGLWTPTIQDNSASDAEGQTYSIQTGSYTKIGNRVFIQGFLAVSSIGTLTGADTARIAGLPFTSNPDFPSNGGAIHVGAASDLAIGAGDVVSGTVTTNTNHISLQLWDAVTGSTVMTITEFSTGGNVVFNGHYIV